MDIQRTAQLAGVLLEAGEKIHEIKGYGKHWFYLVYDPRSKDSTLNDIIARVKLGSLLDIARGGDQDHTKFVYMHPELYLDSEKDAALADAKARLEKIKKA